MHPQVAKHCIAHGKHLVTASYVSPEMKALDSECVLKPYPLRKEPETDKAELERKMYCC
jgi:alpha-aminoadipic semialdehyde synthase